MTVQATETRMEYMSAPTRVAIYTRISDDSEGTALGVTRQREDCLARAEREGWHVVGIYPENDTGASTRTRKKRKEYPAMLDAAKRGEFDVILSYSNSRLTRRPRELEDLIDLHEAHGVKICTIVSGDDDLSTADGRAWARQKALNDAREAELTGERLKRSQQQNRERGGQSTKRAFGWTIEHVKDEHGSVTLQRGKPVRLPDPLHPVEGPALAEGLRMIREGMSVASVARYWNGLGLTTTSGKPWPSTRTRDVLIRWRNAGVIVHNGKPVEGVAGAWEAVCTREELEEVRALLNADKTQQPKRGRPASALLSGIATCGRCGRVMFGARQTGGKKPAGAVYALTYKCSGSMSHAGDKCWTSILRETLEKEVITELLHRQMRTPANVTEDSPEASRLSALRASQSAVQAKIGHLVEAVAEGALKASDIAAKRAELEKEEKAVTEQISALLLKNAELALTAELSATLWTKTPGKVSLIDAADVQKRLRARFESMPQEQKRTLIRSLGPITVLPGRSDRVRFANSENQEAV